MYVRGRQLKTGTGEATRTAESEINLSNVSSMII